MDSIRVPGIEEYPHIVPGEACLDGWFTADQLRQIADKIEEVTGTKDRQEDATPIQS